MLLTKLHIIGGEPDWYKSIIVPEGFSKYHNRYIIINRNDSDNYNDIADSKHRIIIWQKGYKGAYHYKCDGYCINGNYVEGIGDTPEEALESFLSWCIAFDKLIQYDDNGEIRYTAQNIRKMTFWEHLWNFEIKQNRFFTDGVMGQIEGTIKNWYDIRYILLFIVTFGLFPITFPLGMLTRTFSSRICYGVKGLGRLIK